MATLDLNADIAKVRQLLQDYCFEAGDCDIEAVVAGWLNQFDLAWISSAIVEALYQGRYKLVSVDQLLRFWQRRGQPLRHFNREFESIIVGVSPVCLVASELPEGPEQQAPAPGPSLYTPAISPSAPATTDNGPSSKPLGAAGQAPSTALPEGPPQGEPNPDLEGFKTAPEAASLGGDLPHPQAEAVNPFLAAVRQAAATGNDPTVPAEAVASSAALPSPAPVAAWAPRVRPLPPLQSGTETIPPFVPVQDSTELYQRLQAVAHRPIR